MSRFWGNGKFPYTNINNLNLDWMIKLVLELRDQVVALAGEIGGFYTKPESGIPKSDLSAGVQASLNKADSALQSVPSTYRTAIEQDAIDSTISQNIVALKNKVLVNEQHDFSNDQLFEAIILANGKWQGQLDGRGRSSIVKIPENCVKIVASNPNSAAAILAFLRGQSYPRTGGTPEFSDNHGSRISLAAGATAEYIVDSDMRFLYVSRVSVSGANVTPTIIFECVRPETSAEPLYVAFGASTTIGAVHGYTSSASDVVTYSDKNYPAMVGNALGLRTVNLGQGSTGFLKRGTGYDTKNFMDAIYDASDYLKDASLVSLVFGYGNDGAAGLPIGAWDDYYPYDKEGYHPAGDTGVTTMLSKGCTLMGCLNWCIKWLQEKYPRAQLVLIFGAPSANKDREVGMQAQTEGAGIAPYKLTVTDPYTNASGLNAKIKEISVELAKLKSALNIPIFDTFIEDGIPFSWYATKAKDSDGSFAVFSTTGSAAAPEWNSHPNVDGYEIWGRYISGLIVSMYKQ